MRMEGSSRPGTEGPPASKPPLLGLLGHPGPGCRAAHPTPPPTSSGISGGQRLGLWGAVSGGQREGPRCCLESR